MPSLSESAKMASYKLSQAADDHIKQDYRRSVFAAHSIYYTVENDDIKIIWILGRQDPNKALSEQAY